MPSPSEPFLYEPDFIPDSSVVGCTFSWPNYDSDCELVPDNAMSALSSELVVGIANIETLLSRQMTPSRLCNLVGEMSEAQ